MKAASAFLRHRSSKTLKSALLGFALFLLCLFGIVTRPGVDLASFWPANAFMLGMLVRFPRLANPMSWLACAAGFVAADLITGGSLFKTIVLNLGNLCAIAAGYFVLTRFSRSDQRLSGPNSALYMMLAIAAAALTAGLIGTVADPILFGGKSLDALLYWSATELVNHVAFLPVILTLPDAAGQKLRAALRHRPGISSLLPLIALVATALAGAAIGGPGAIAFPVLALLWCAVTYSLFATACLAFAFVAWTLLAISTGYLPVAENFTDRQALLSIRFGVSLLGLAPLMVASVMAARQDVMQKLLYLSRYDQMTGVLNRSAFMNEAAKALNNENGQQFSVLMLDIDHFKSINDQYGHAAGDSILIAFATILRDNIREDDTVGRLGGEEFAVVLHSCSMPDAEVVASRIKAAFADSQIEARNGQLVQATVSIGITTGESPAALDRLLAQADEALYEAKRRGRNRISTKAA